MESSVDLVKLIERFGSEDKCRAYLEDLRWPNGVECPRCESKSVAAIPSRNQFDCNACRYQFSVTAGTLFHDSHLPLWKWFLAIYLMGESKKGISSKQLQRMLGVSYKTAWYLSHRIRDAMGDDDQPLLKGIIEVDETYVGGKRTNVGRGFKDNKSVVVGAVQRDGEIRLKVLPTNSKKELHGFIRAYTDDAAVAIYTDEAQMYRGIEDGNTRHEAVQHRAEEWVRGDVHTQTVEGVWSLFKRSLIGSYHQVSVKHLPAYLDELEFRYNGRDNPFLFRDTLMVLLHGDTLPYSKLIAREPIKRQPVTQEERNARGGQRSSASWARKKGHS